MQARARGAIPWPAQAAGGPAPAGRLDAGRPRRVVSPPPLERP